MNLLVQAFLWIVVTFLVSGLVLFIPAGTLGWSAGWVYLILLFSYSLVIIGVLYATNRDLLRDRLSLSQPHQDPRDRVLTPVLLLLGLGWFALMPLDAVRFQWSHVPVILQVIGAIVLMSSLPIVLLTFRENTFATTAVRVQDERGQQVIVAGAVVGLFVATLACGVIALIIDIRNSLRQLVQLSRVARLREDRTTVSSAGASAAE